MVSQELIDYVKKQQETGVTKEQIIETLESAGWNKEDINEAFAGNTVQQETTTSYLSPLNVIVTEEAQVEPEKKVKLPLNKWFLAFFLLLIILVGSGIYGYFFYYLAPERVLARMLKNMESVQSLDYKADVNIDFAGNYAETSAFLPDKYSFSLSMSGTSDVTDIDNPKASFDIQLSAQNLFSSNFELMVFKDILFIKLKDLPDFGLFDTQTLTNQWIKIDTKEFGEIGGKDLGEEVEVLTAEEEKELKEFIRDNPPLEIIEKMEGEKVEEFDTFHYKYRISKDNLIKIVEKTAELTESEFDEKEKEGFRDAMAKVDFYDGEIWIDKKTEHLVKGALAFAYKENDNSSQELTFDSVFIFKNFNNATKIVEPIEFKDVNELIEEYEKALQQDSQLIPEGLDLEEFQIEPGGISLDRLVPSVLGIQKTQ